MLTAVTYHYVRPSPDADGRRVQGRSPEEFLSQVEWLTRHHRFVALADLIRAMHGGPALPDRAALLTFDDGLAEHADFVAPELARRGIPAVFFLTVDALVHRRMLAPHRLHAILGGHIPVQVLLVRLFELLEAARAADPRLPSEATLRAAHERPGEFDDAATMCFKRLLQRELPEPVRERIARQLFAEHVSADEAAIADRWYLAEADVPRMIAAGHAIGGHGRTHRWLSHLETAEQADEIAASRALVERFAGPGAWAFCYPHGGHTDETVRLLAAAGCAAAFTVERRSVEEPAASPLRLSRLDTNDLPIG